jgi:hypothetical protein
MFASGHRRLAPMASSEGASPMFSIEVDPKWYDNYWLGAHPRNERRSFSQKVAWFAALVILLAGGGLVLDY